MRKPLGEVREEQEVENQIKDRGIPDRNLKSFLLMDIRHDIWKDVQATMEEVKKLEQEIENHTRKQDVQSQSRIN